MNMKSITKKVDVTLAACCLHNFCILAKDVDVRELEMAVEDVSSIPNKVLWNNLTITCKNTCSKNIKNNKIL